MDREAQVVTVSGVTKSRTRLSDFHFALDTLPESSHWVFTTSLQCYYLYFPNEEIEAVR